MLGDILQNGGAILVFIAIASVLGLAVAIERCVRLLPLNRKFDLSWQGFESSVHQGQRKATGDDNAMGRVIDRGLSAVPAGADAVRIAGLEAAQREVAGLERGLGILSTIAQVAPLLGLLGTVAGLMQAFQAAGGTDQVTHTVLADGIYKALGTTAAGLGVAIPAYIAYSSLSSVANKLIDHLEMVAGELPALLITNDS